MLFSISLAIFLELVEYACVQSTTAKVKSCAHVRFCGVKNVMLFIRDEARINQVLYQKM